MNPQQHRCSFASLVLIVWCLQFSLAPTLHAAAVTGDPLDIGTGNTFTSSGQVGAIGYGNVLTSAGDSLAVGLYNIISGTGQVAFGEWNTINDGSFYNLVSGVANAVSSFFNGANLVVGDANVLMNTVEATFAESTALFGYLNTGNNLRYCLISGSLNDVTTAEDSAVIGHGLIQLSGTYYQVAVGKYNEPDPEPLFIVGNGSGPVNRSNAFVVHSDGDATVAGVLRVTAPAGDIPMFAP